MRGIQNLGALRRHLQGRPRLARGISQTLSDPTAWNQAPGLVTVLPNGVRVATKETFGETTSVAVMVNAGVRNETVGTVGASHLIEQLALTGTKKRGKAQLETEVESMGATLNVAAGRETTSYVMNVMNSDVKQGVDILSDLVTNTGISNFAKEKAGIIRALNERDLSSEDVVKDRLHACAFRDTSLGFSTVGPFDGVENITDAQLQQYVSANYTAENMVIAATGPLKHEELVKLAAASLGGVKAGTPAPMEKPYFCGAELIYRNDEMGPTAYIACGWEAVPWKSPDAVTFMVMSSIIGKYVKGQGLVPGNLSGNRTINNVANKMDVGCADAFEAFTTFYKDTGLFGFYIACDEVAVEHAIGELMFSCGIMAHAVTDEEVQRGKRELKVALTSKAGGAEALGQEVLVYGRHIPLAEMMLRIEAVDAEDVKRVAWKYLADQEVAVTGLGPLHGMPQYYDLRRASNMHRY
jgi:processing peptidase subunit beta